MSNNYVSCTSLHGARRRVHVSRITIRPSAYAIIVRNSRILLVRVKATGRWFFPGGGARKAELLSDALRREVWEETGLESTIRAQLGTWEHFFYYDPDRRAYHMYLTFYLCTVRNESVRDAQDPREATDRPTWVPLDDLKRTEFDPVLRPVLDMALVAEKAVGLAWAADR